MAGFKTKHFSGSAERTKLSCVMPASDPPPQCIMTVHHILVRAIILLKKRKYIFGGRVVVESRRFHPAHFLFNLKVLVL